MRTLIGLAFALGLVFAPLPRDTARMAFAKEATCPEGDESIECKAQAGDRIALYVLGRNAYDSARESGDFTEAHRLARQLDATGDKNGDRLLKMVNLQLGWGGHNDYVEAYVWLSEGIAGGKDYLVSWRSRLAEKMTAEQLAQAKEMAASGNCKAAAQRGTAGNTSTRSPLHAALIEMIEPNRE